MTIGLETIFKSLRQVLAVCFLFCLIDRESSLADASSSVQIQKIRIIKNYINHVVIQCPVSNTLVRPEHIKWINERYDYTKPDEEVLVSSQNLIVSSQLNLQLYDGLTYFSCGYILNNCYVRVKLWQVECVANPSVFLKIDYNPTLINFISINDTFGTISVVPNAKPLDWNKQLDLLRLKCINNFDYPINTKYIWMYVQNQARFIYETWHRYDIEPLTNPVENVFQTFYNPDQNRNCPLSDFLRNLCSDPNNLLIFQCASYFEKANSHDKVYLLADSKNFTITCDDAKPPVTLPPTIPPTFPTIVPPITLPPVTIPILPPIVPPHAPDYGALIGGIVGGVLGLLLLLCLLGLLLFLCWRCRRQRRNARKCQTINIEANSSSSIVYPNCATNSQVMYCNTADKASQFSNQIEISNMDTVSCYGGAGGQQSVIHHAAAPETYLRMITIQKECCDDNISSSNEMITTNQYDSYNAATRTAYCTDEEAFQHSERRDYFIHNYQHQSECTGGHFV